MFVDNKSFPFYEDLSDEEKELFEKSITVKMIQAGTIIRAYEPNSFGPFLIVDGRIRVYLHNEKSRDVFLYSLSSGDFCVLTESRTIVSILFEAELEVETNALVVQLEPNCFEKIMKNNLKVRSLIYETLIERLSVFVDNIQAVLFDPIECRVARYIIEEYNRSGLFVIRKTQDEIAKNVSSSREVICRVLRKLSREGIVSCEKGEIRLLDIEKIRKFN